MTHPATFDLLTLNGGATALLASGEVPAGAYGRIHLDISDATSRMGGPLTADECRRIEEGPISRSPQG